MKKFLKVMLVVTSPIWLLAAYLIVNAIAYEKPVVKYAEFPFVLTYEVNGKEITVDDILVCEYDGLGCDEGNGFFRKWKGYIKGTGEERILIYESGGTTIFTYIADPIYLMGIKYMVLPTSLGYTWNLRGGVTAKRPVLQRKNYASSMESVSQAGHALNRLKMSLNHSFLNGTSSMQIPNIICSNNAYSTLLKDFIVSTDTE